MAKANFQFSISNFQSGQTLIETLVALFILVMGVGSAVGLAVYALNGSSGITKQIIGAGLAREGIEITKNMRDTNWLNDTLTVNGCYDYASGQVNKANCYTNWLGSGHSGYCLDPTRNNGNCDGNGASTVDYSLGFNTSAGVPGLVWNFNKLGAGVTNYGMTFDPNNSTGQGFYNQDGTIACGAGANPADFCRQVLVTYYSTEKVPSNAITPYDQDPNLGLLYIQSQVWWIDKKCPRVNDFNSAPLSCRLELDSYLTNWKNY